MPSYNRDPKRDYNFDNHSHIFGPLCIQTAIWADGLGLGWRAKPQTLNPKQRERGQETIGLKAETSCMQHKPGLGFRVLLGCGVQAIIPLGNIRGILGLYGVNGKENGNYYNGLYRV